MKSIVKKCRLCGQRYPTDYAGPCDVDFGDDWLFWCEKHEKPAQARGCDECAFKFLGSLIFEPAELGLALFESWSEAIEETKTRRISDWLVETGPDRTLAHRIREIDQDDQISPEDKLSLEVMLLRGDSVLCWHGKLLDWSFLCSDENQGLHLLRSDFGVRVATLGLGTWLYNLKKEWHSIAYEICTGNVPSSEQERSAFGILLSKEMPNNLLAVLGMSTLVPRLQARKLANIKSAHISEITGQQRRSSFALPDKERLNEVFAIICRGIQVGAMSCLDNRLACEATFVLAWDYNGRTLIEHDAFRQAFQAHLKANVDGRVLQCLIFSYFREFSRERTEFVTAVAGLIRSYLRESDIPEFAAWRALDSAYGLFLGPEAPKRCARQIDINEDLEEQLLSLGLRRSVRWRGFSAELMLEWLKVRGAYSFAQWNTLRRWMERCTPALEGREGELISAIILPWTRKSAPNAIRSSACSYLIGRFGKPQANHIIWQRCSQIVRETVSEWLFLASLDKLSELTVTGSETTREFHPPSRTARTTHHNEFCRFLRRLRRAIRLHL
jgi:EH_Signature domain